MKQYHTICQDKIHGNGEALTDKGLIVSLKIKDRMICRFEQAKENAFRDLKPELKGD
jgi:hypothetical protein